MGGPNISAELLGPARLKICSHKGPNISGGVLLLQEKMDPPVQIFHNIWTGGGPGGPF